MDEEILMELETTLQAIEDGEIDSTEDALGSLTNLDLLDSIDEHAGDFVWPSSTPAKREDIPLDDLVRIMEHIKENY